MVDFDCCVTGKRKTDENEPEYPETKKARSASGKKKAPLFPSSRFNKTCNEAEIAKSSKGVVPQNTARSTNWARHVFQEWVTQRNKRSEEKFPTDLFDNSHSAEIICKINVYSDLCWKLEERTALHILLRLFISCLVDCYDIQGQFNLIMLIFLIEETRFKALHNTCDSEF